MRMSFRAVDIKIGVDEKETEVDGSVGVSDGEKSPGVATAGIQ